MKGGGGFSYLVLNIRLAGAARPRGLFQRLHLPIYLFIWPSAFVVIIILGIGMGWDWDGMGWDGQGRSRTNMRSADRIVRNLTFLIDKGRKKGRKKGKKEERTEGRKGNDKISNSISHPTPSKENSHSTRMKTKRGSEK